MYCRLGLTKQKYVFVRWLLMLLFGLIREHILLSHLICNRHENMFFSLSHTQTYSNASMSAYSFIEQNIVKYASSFDRHFSQLFCAQCELCTKNSIWFKMDLVPEKNTTFFNSIAYNRLAKIVWHFFQAKTTFFIVCAGFYCSELD